MNHLNICISAPARLPVKGCLDEKGFNCIGFSISDTYIRINLDNYSYHSFREVKGQKFVYFNRKHLSALRLVPKEAVIQFLISAAGDNQWQTQ